MSSRFRRPAGRFFSTRYELERQDRDISIYQDVYGTEVQWWFYDRTNSETDDVYDEGAFFGGRRWDGPHRVPVLSAMHLQGPDSTDDGGQYNVDHIQLRVSYNQLQRIGFGPLPDQDTTTHYSDRFVYDNKVFTVDSISVRGQFEQTGRDVIVAITATQLRPDDLVNDVDFARYSA